MEAFIRFHFLFVFLNERKKASFKDVSSTRWANNAIQFAVSKGYFKGYADGTFKPKFVAEEGMRSYVLKTNH
ncbi:S-layer homology domain-containing protein [Paenibacillus sp. FSL H8-0317]|uniref:S-layer homology domain-containing protein n=1 Tax=unclassified Paenibacillus TaxID=185978 RepID=UPI0030CE282D